MTPDIRKERETALYEAALRLIAKGVNPAAMKVQQIADEAGIGKGTVYEYFASKDEILQGMALYCFDTEIARIAVLMEPCTTLQELEDAVMAYLQNTFRQPDGVTYLIGAYGHSAEKRSLASVYILCFRRISFCSSRLFLLDVGCFYACQTKTPAKKRLRNVGWQSRLRHQSFSSFKSLYSHPRPINPACSPLKSAPRKITLSGTFSNKGRMCLCSAP
mgnify:CR=1 FL=1